ncbi:hypothetical protein V8F33_011888 [Rhypophila sp. PSN 637]
MDNISSNVRKVQTNLHSSRRLLTTIESNGKRELTSEVSGMRDSIKAGDDKLVNASAQVRSYLLQIENVPKAETTVDMKPQMGWLHKSLDSVVSSFGEAQNAAGRALRCTTECSYRVLDVGQEVEKNREKLSDYQRQARVLADQASSSLRTSETLLREAREQMREKEAEIRRKTSEAAALRERKRELAREIPQKEAEIREAERQRQSKKEDAALAAVTDQGAGILGIIAAPFTFGLSLGVTAASAGVVGYKISRADDLKAEANALRSRVSTLNSEISQSERDAASLEQEKTELQARIRGYEAEISSRQTKNRGYQKQITEATKVGGEIKELDSHAQSTAANVNDDNRQLQKWKQTLDKCNELIQAKSLEVETQAGLVEWFGGKLGHRIGNKMKRSREFKRQKVVMEQLAQTLDEIHSQVPMLLPRGEKMKFLDGARYGSKSKVTVGVTEVDEIPAVSLHVN